MKYTRLFVFVAIIIFGLSSCSNPSRRPLEVLDHERLINVTAYRSFSIDYFRMLANVKYQYSQIPVSKYPELKNNSAYLYYSSLDADKLYAKFKQNLKSKTKRDETYSFAYKLSDYPAWKSYEHKRNFYNNMNGNKIVKSFKKVDQKAYKKKIAYAKRILELELSFIVADEILKKTTDQIPQYETKTFMKINFSSMMKVSREISLPYYFLVIKSMKDEDIEKIIKIYEGPEFKLYKKVLIDTVISDLEEHKKKGLRNEV
ncbi:hypothetical protein ACRXCV_09395 [Halobacteriovorax sp. GFR7]|uniref:hypothetical protein n=1 Tax=unclassified Halobacteriovorax TaxID=2639665 RepID=UPI003D990F5F